jgi:phosphoenolpyruvate synthase/pyruvate phosphate dikinase
MWREVILTARGGMTSHAAVRPAAWDAAATAGMG